MPRGACRAGVGRGLPLSNVHCPLPPLPTAHYPLFAVRLPPPTHKGKHMGTYPTTPRSAFLAWCQAHELVFQNNAAAIGLTPAMAAAFKTVTDTAAADAQAQEVARQAAL